MEMVLKAPKKRSRSGIIKQAALNGRDVMNFRTAVYTDVGIRKKTNQDSALIETADTDEGRVSLAVVCDGMGGLAMGEVASAVLIRAFSDWFEKRFPFRAFGLCRHGGTWYYDPFRRQVAILCREIRATNARIVGDEVRPCFGSRIPHVQGFECILQGMQGT